MAAIVVDTSVLIDYFEGGRFESLVEAMAAGLVFVPSLVVAEVVAGATTIEQRRTIGEFLQEVPVLDAPLAHWIDVRTLRRDLRRKGLTVTLPDAHIAQCALDLDAVLLTRDAVFAQIAQHTRLRLTSAAS